MTMVKGIDHALSEPAILNQPTVHEEATGYVHSSYCESLSEFGRPRFLPRSGGWILERQIPNSAKFDAMGSYPLFACQNWSLLHADFKSLGDALVSVALVTDPFGEYEISYLQKCFPHLVTPFKEHFVVDLSLEPKEFVHSHHQRHARKARREMRVETCDHPMEFLDDWLRLYRTLIERHEITGLTAFSRASFEKQLRVPGLTMLRAVHEDATIGMLLWYAQGNRAYYHLGAYGALGYELGASFALFDFALRYFAERGLAWLNLGSGAGVQSSSQGLGRFKRGWATGTRTAYLCGRIFDRRSYDDLLRTNRMVGSDYFPAYREREFG